MKSRELPLRGVKDRGLCNKLSHRFNVLVNKGASLTQRSGNSLLFMIRVDEEERVTASLRQRRSLINEYVNALGYLIS